MSKRNSRAAKAARRTRTQDRRPAYPVMPPGTCYGSATILAACYPELRYAEGIRTWTLGGRTVVLEHAWNVDTDTGEIWDATLAPEARRLAHELKAGELTYAEGESTLAPDAFAGWCSVTLEAVAGKTWESKRAAIEWVGRALASLPCDCPDLSPDGCKAHGPLQLPGSAS